MPSDDAQLLQVIGRGGAGAEQQSLDRIVQGRITRDEETARQRLIDAEVAVTQAQLVIIAAALNATTTVFDALGASGVSEERSLDRHWRNARTLASHNPRRR